MEIWDEALLVYEKILYIPISSGLSGSCSTAALLSYEESYKGKVYVVDNGRVSVPQFCTILDAFDLIERGRTPEEIKETLEEYRADEVIYVAIDDIAHLKKGGRISPTAAVAASILNIKPIMKFDVGTIDVYKKCRGMNWTKKEMFEAIRHDLETKFRSWYERGDYYLMTATAVEKEDNESFVKEVQQAFPGVKVHSGLLDIIDYLESLPSAKYAIFATCGYIPTEDYKKRLRGNLDVWFPDNGEYLGMFICQGKVERDRQNIMIGKMPTREAQLKKMFEEGRSHPDAEDLDAAANFAERIQEIAEYQ